MSLDRWRCVLREQFKPVTEPQSLATTTMPSRKTKKKYKPEHLTECLHLIKDEKKSAADARKIVLLRHGVVIPKATLSVHLKGRKLKGGIYKIPTKPVGAPTKLSPRQEQVLNDMCIKAWECGTPLTRTQLCRTARDLELVERSAVLWITNSVIKQPRKRKRFGRQVSKEWLYGFLGRWKLSERVCKDREAKRTSALNAETLVALFEAWTVAIKTGYNGKPYPKDRMYNMDEFGNQPRCEKQAKGILPKGTQGAVQRGGAGDRKSYTGIACANAAGERLPLSFIFKLSESNDERTPICQIADKHGGVATFATGQDESHMMTIMIFKSWVKWFAEQVGAKPEDPVLLLVDGHLSRFPSEGVFFAHEYGVHMFVLPGALTSHVQPQDVGILGPFKREVYNNYREHCAEHPWCALRAHNHMEFVVKAWQKKVTKNVIRNAWEKAGLVMIDDDDEPSCDIAKLIPALRMASVFRKDAYEQTAQVKELLDMVWKGKAPDPAYLLESGAEAPIPDELVDALKNADHMTKEDMERLFRVLSDVIAIPAEKERVKYFREAWDKKAPWKAERRQKLEAAKTCTYFAEELEEELQQLLQKKGGRGEQNKARFFNIAAEEQLRADDTRVDELKKMKDSAKVEAAKVKKTAIAAAKLRKVEERQAQVAAIAAEKLRKENLAIAEKEEKKAERAATVAALKAAAKELREATAAARAAGVPVPKKRKAPPGQAGGPGDARSAKKARSNLSAAPLDVSRDHATAPDEDWVQCCGPAGCSKWRRVPTSICQGADADDATWLCSDNLDEKHNSCDIPQELPDDEIDAQIEAAMAAVQTQPQATTTAIRARVNYGDSEGACSPRGQVDGARGGGLLVAKRGRSDNAAGHGKSSATAVKPRNQANLTGKRARPAGGAAAPGSSKKPKKSGQGCAEKRPDTVARIRITPVPPRKKKPQVPEPRPLGCSKCRHAVLGCGQCRNPDYRPRK